jgi:hypothetical protein
VEGNGANNVTASTSYSVSTGSHQALRLVPSPSPSSRCARAFTAQTLVPFGMVVAATPNKAHAHDHGQIAESVRKS